MQVVKCTRAQIAATVLSNCTDLVRSRTVQRLVFRALSFQKDVEYAGMQRSAEI